MHELTKKALLSQEASKSLAISDSQDRNVMLEELANFLYDHRKQILNENNRDYLASKKKNDQDAATLERLILSEKNIDDIISGVLNISKLPDPIGNIFDQNELENGLKVYKKRVPLGVIGIIYEIL